MSRELKSRWICRECDWVGRDGEYLTAPNPFDGRVVVTGCPRCRECDSMESGCQSKGCDKRSSSGTPDVGGFRYVWACWDHSPRRGRFEADPALVDAT